MLIKSECNLENIRKKIDRVKLARANIQLFVNRIPSLQ